MNSLQDLLEDSSKAVTREWLDEVWSKYPYFTLPALLYLHRNKDKGGLDDGILRKLAISSPDRKALYDLLGENAERFASFYPPEKKREPIDTDTTLDTFLENYGNVDDKELEILNQMIFNPVPDYAQMLAAEEERSKPGVEELTPDAGVGRDDLLINQFISKSKEKPSYFPTQEAPSAVQVEPNVAEEPVDAPIATDDTMLSESLARIYIKQRKYSKALEIIKTISLKFPEKSIYFADQIRFLQKLIKTETIKNNK